MVGWEKEDNGMNILHPIHGDKNLESRFISIEEKCDRLIALLEKREGSRKLKPIFEIKNRDIFLLEGFRND